ncbi:MAG: hypothetical protein JW876_01435 [Candidatus Krumholzibacteriota bacterium]|nr:hypothetical protein [Candidatus Krumholzibacteriota bacterium]
MHQINVVVFETEVDAVAKEIVRLGILHLVQLDEHEDWVGQLKDYETRKMQGRIDGLAGRVAQLMKSLGIRELPLEARDGRHLEITPADLDGMDREMAALEQKVEGLGLRRKELQVKYERLQGIMREVAPLDVVGLSPERAPYTFLEIRYGQVRAENLGYVREKLAPLAAVALPLVVRDGDQVLLVIGLKTDRLKLKRILREAAFEEIEVPEEAKGDPGLVTGELEKRIAGLAEQIGEVDGELAALRGEHAEAVTEYHRSLKVAELLLKVKTYLKRTAKTYIFSGWIPSDKRQTVEREIYRAARGRAIIEIIPPEEIAGVREGTRHVPVLLRHPGFFRPFEMLVSSYGLPEYSFLDPTFFVAISFLAMFGMMFGDVGHGFILAAIGWMLGFRGGAERADATRLIGKLAFYCGLSSIVFGFLFGSIFGLEELLPSLWMKPMHDVLYFFRVAVYFGIAMISIGILLNVINAIRTRNYKATFFDHAGIVSAVIYWGGIGVVSIFLANRPIPVRLLLLAVGLPILVLFLREPLAAVFSRRRPRFEKGLMTYLMETVIEVMEIVTGYLGNTVSFIRVAAFSLAHVGLFIAVFSLVDMVKGKSGGWAYSAIILVIGNAVVIALEGLVVTIQAIRLEYYEFFGKFFLGGGTAYKPIGLGPARRRAEGKE